MRIAFAVFLVAHGLIHLAGGATAFGITALPELNQSISRPMGLLWFGAAALLLVTAGALMTGARRWWLVGLVALVLSQLAIAGSWGDARFGTIANGVLALGLLAGYLVEGPSSDRARYRREVTRRLERRSDPRIVTEQDLVALPAPVQGYLRLAGVVGKPTVANFRARLHGEIRGGPNARWMRFTAEQYDFYHDRARLFLMRASRMGLPFQALHLYLRETATMQVRLGALVPIVDAKGPVMDQSETVTLFNDMCVYAPATLIDPAIRWESVDAHTVRATFTNAGHTIQAVLDFNEAGELVDFFSGDRSKASPDGKSFVRLGWSTPLRAYREYGDYRLSSEGEGRWHAPDGEFAYITIVLDEIEYNASADGRPPRHDVPQ